MGILIAPSRFSNGLSLVIWGLSFGQCLMPTALFKGVRYSEGTLHPHCTLHSRSSLKREPL
jgi:hypothetical protein